MASSGIDAILSPYAALSPMKTPKEPGHRIASTGGACHAASTRLIEGYE